MVILDPAFTWFWSSLNLQHARIDGVYKALSKAKKVLSKAFLI